MTPNPPHKASSGASSSAYGSEVGGGWTQGGCRLHIVPWGQIKAYGIPCSTPATPSSGSVLPARMIVEDNVRWDQSRCLLKKHFRMLYV